MTDDLVKRHVEQLRLTGGDLADLCQPLADAIEYLIAERDAADALIEAQAKDHASNNIRFAEAEHRAEAAEAERDRLRGGAGSRPLVLGAARMGYAHQVRAEGRDAMNDLIRREDARLIALEYISDSMERHGALEAIRAIPAVQPDTAPASNLTARGNAATWALYDANLTRMGALQPAHVNETAKSEHDARDVLTPAAKGGEA